MNLESLGRSLVLGGVFLAVLGLLLVLVPKLPFLGRLPGDISVQNDKFQLFLPLGTCLAVSAGLTIVLNIILRILGK